MSGVLSMLARERQRLTANVPRQPSEAVMQAAANARERAALPSLLPPAPTKDVAAWNDWAEAYKKQHPNGPTFAPPEYIAWANARLEPASGSTYRFEVQYAYDPNSGALLAVENAQTGFVYWQAATSPGPDAFGQLQAYTDGNNVSTVVAYDAATGAPVGIGTGTDASPYGVQQLIYAWDGYGNLKQRCDVNRGLAENVANDDLNRLTGTSVYTGVSVSSGLCVGGSTTNTLSLKYDAAGNILTRTMAGTSESYTYDPSHPYAVNGVSDSSGTLYSASYDADGNMLSRNGYALTWTPANLPESIASSTGSSTFSYDPDHARYYQAATFNGITTDTTYVGGLFEVISTSTGSTEYRHNIVADGAVIAVHTIDGNGAASTSYLHYDHLGSVDAITDDQGSVIQSMSFDAFGLRRDAANWDYDLSQNTLSTLKNYTDRGFTFQEELDNLSLVDLNGRVYDPTVGRFISADPTIPEPFFSQGFNRYAYVDNSPLVFTDPSGFETDACTTPGMAQECDGPGGTAIGFIIGTPGPGEWGYQGSDGSSCNLVACTSDPLPNNGAPAGNQNMGLTTSQNAQLGKVLATSKPCLELSWCQAELTQQYLDWLGIQNFFKQSFTLYPSTAASCESNPVEDACAMAALAYAEGGHGCPPNCQAIIAVESNVMNRVDNPTIPNSQTIFDVIFAQSGGYQSVEQPSAAFADALLTPTQLTGQDAQAYQFALDAAPLVMNFQIPDPTSGATFFYSGFNPGSYFEVTLPGEGYHVTLVIPANPPIFTMTFLAPSAKGGGG